MNNHFMVRCPLSFFGCLFACLLAGLLGCLLGSFCLFVSLFVCLFVCLPVCLFVCLSVCLFVWWVSPPQLYLWLCSINLNELGYEASLLSCWSCGVAQKDQLCVNNSHKAENTLIPEYFPCRFANFREGTSHKSFLNFSPLFFWVYKILLNIVDT